MGEDSSLPCGLVRRMSPCGLVRRMSPPRSTGNSKKSPGITSQPSALYPSNRPVGLHATAKVSSGTRLHEFPIRYDKFYQQLYTVRPNHNRSHNRKVTPFKLHHSSPNIIGDQTKERHAVAQLVEALRYKSEGRGFDPRWCHWSFSLT